MAVNLLGRARSDAQVTPATAGRGMSGHSAATAKTVPWYRRPALLRAIAPLTLLVAWQIASGTGLLSEEILPAPSKIAEAGAQVWRSGELTDALLVSTQRAALGFLLGAVLGIGLGVLAALSKFGEYAVDPPLQMLRTVPLFGLIPLFIIWFGIDEAPKVYLIALGVLFPLYLNTFAAIRQLDPKLVEVGDVLGLSRGERLTNLVIPGALPQILVGMRQSLGIAWLTLIVAEQVNAGAGLGYIVNNAREFLRTDIVIFGLLVYGLLGLITDSIVRRIEVWALRWRPEAVR